MSWRTARYIVLVVSAVFAAVGFATTHVAGWSLFSSIVTTAVILVLLAAVGLLGARYGGSTENGPWLYRNRGWMTWLFIGVVLTQLTGLVLTVAKIGFYPSHTLLIVNIGNQVDLLLATGTLTLAFAALVQVSAGEAARREEAGWREQQREDRAKDRQPHLIFGVRRVGVRRIPSTTASAYVPPDAVEPPAFEQAEFYVENVGPGIAANLSAVLVTMYIDVAGLIDIDGAPTPDPWFETLSPEQVLRSPARAFFSRRMELPTPYLARGPENRMRLLNADEWERFSVDENMELDRMYLVIIECSDLEDGPRRKTVGGIYRVPKVLGIEGGPSDIEEEWYKNSSRWFRADQEDIGKVVQAWTESEALKTSSAPPSP